MLERLAKKSKIWREGMALESDRDVGMAWGLTSQLSTLMREPKKRFVKNSLL
jgi:hypothetical protein